MKKTEVCVKKYLLKWRWWWYKIGRILISQNVHVFAACDDAVEFIGSDVDSPEVNEGFL